MPLGAVRPRPALAVLLFVSVAAGLTLAAQPQTPRLLTEGVFHLLVLPPGSTEVLLSQSGRRAAVGAVTFNMDRSMPERLVVVVDLAAPRIVWQRSLPSATCCAFPVLAATPEGDAVAVGGAEQTLLFTPDGRQDFVATLNDRRLHSALNVSDDGRLIVIGEWEGRIAAFERGRKAPLWKREVGQDLMAIAVSGNAEVVVAASRREVLLFRARDGVLLSRREYGPARIAAVAISRDGDRAGLVWKRQDERMVLEFIERGRPVWVRELHFGTVPLLQMDEQGRWLAVADLLGRQAALYSSRSEVVWKAAGAGRVAIGVAPDGSRAAMAAGNVVEIRSLPSGRTAWRDRLPGVAHLMRLAGPRLAILGSVKNEGLPDRIWFVEVSGSR